jgi:hypothetical protein
MPAMIVDSAIYVDGHRAAEPASPDEALDALEGTASSWRRSASRWSAPTWP